MLQVDLVSLSCNNGSIVYILSIDSLLGSKDVLS